MSVTGVVLKTAIYGYIISISPNASNPRQIVSDNCLNLESVRDVFGYESNISISYQK